MVITAKTNNQDWTFQTERFIIMHTWVSLESNSSNAFCRAKVGCDNEINGIIASSNNPSLHKSDVKIFSADTPNILHECSIFSYTYNVIQYGRHFIRYRLLYVCQNFLSNFSCLLRTKGSFSPCLLHPLHSLQPSLHHPFFSKIDPILYSLYCYSQRTPFAFDI